MLVGLLLGFLRVFVIGFDGGHIRRTVLDLRCRGATLGDREQLVEVHLGEAGRPRDVLPVDEHADLFAEEFESTVGNGTFVSELADRISILVRGLHGLERALGIFAQSLHDPGLIHGSGDGRSFNGCVFKISTL